MVVDCSAGMQLASGVSDGIGALLCSGMDRERRDPLVARAREGPRGRNGRTSCYSRACLATPNDSIPGGILVNTTRKLLAGGIALAAAIGPIAVASDATGSTSSLSVSLSGDVAAGASAVWDSAGNPDLTVGNSDSFADARINNATNVAAPADAPTFTTDNYADGSRLAHPLLWRR